MKILITGICGFVGSSLAQNLVKQPDVEILGIDNLSRSGSWINRQHLTDIGIYVSHGDVRQASDLAQFTDVDWVIDAAAEPSVLAGRGTASSSRRLIENNLIGTIELLELCKANHAGLVLLSTSRVYSIAPLAQQLPLTVADEAFAIDAALPLPTGVTAAGIMETFATSAPISLYGATKLASEQLALEYSHAFEFPVWINRCGVLAGAGQFGKPDQGIFAFWLHSWRENKPLRYIGFDGLGHQVRDCLHPDDLSSLVWKQLQAPTSDAPKVINVSGGVTSSRSLRQLSQWCEQRWGPRQVTTDAANRAYDLPWVVLDSRIAHTAWDWQPTRTTESILSEIADHADQHPDWLARVS